MEKIKAFFKKLTGNGTVRTEGLWRRGGYALAITAAVVAAIILFNYIVSVVAKKVNLEFDLSGNDLNNISAENAKYIKSVKDDVEILVCGAKLNFADNLEAYAQSKNRVANGTDYYNQTVRLVGRYGDLNSKIKVTFVDTQSTEYTSVSQRYSNVELGFGDIIVRTNAGTENEKYKHLGFTDIYEVNDPTGYAAYGYDYYGVASNKIENSLSGAISYVLSEKTYRVGLITGHTSGDNTAAFKTLLTDNNYEIVEIKDGLVASIPADLDAVALLAPNTDFLTSELDAISEFLDNDGKGGKGVIYFADAAAPVLPNLWDFLSEWGINIDEGILFETEEQYIPNEQERSALYIIPTGNSALTKNMNGFITGFNVPMSADTALTDGGLTVTDVASTLESVYNAPAGSDGNFGEVFENALNAYSGVIESKKAYGDKNSFVVAFSSIEFIDSDWAENANLSNKNIVLKATDRVCGADVNGFSFVAKSITNENFANEIDAAASQRVKNIFMFILPILTLVIGIVVYVRRRNSR